MAKKKRSSIDRGFNWRQYHEALRPVGICQRVVDSTESHINAIEWLGGEGRDPALAAEVRAESLILANRGLLKDFLIDADVRRQNKIPYVVLRPSTRIGALPLLSPVTGRIDYGLVVEPRFQWGGIGEILGKTGYKIVPQLLPLPELPQSDRRIPPWVLSSIILVRLKELLEKIARRFILKNEDLLVPKGTVNWTQFSTQRLPIAKAMSIPCEFPDLRDDEVLRSAIHYVLREHYGSLMAQRSNGIVVLQLLGLCESLLMKVAGTSPKRPRIAQLDSWRHNIISSKAFSEGIQAIEWTMEERGLAGLSELSGLSWRLDMEIFFEAWVESIGGDLAKSCGMTIRAGRKEETRVALDWRPPYTGSQRSLIPDIVLERNDVTLIMDAKYKSHAEEIRFGGWKNVDEELRELHRNDILQVLAYSSLFDTPRIIACLVYPCRLDTYESLAARGRLISRALITSGRRRIELALATVPIAGDANASINGMKEIVQKPL
jgi:hypothetical protein